MQQLRPIGARFETEYAQKVLGPPQDDNRRTDLPVLLGENESPAVHVSGSGSVVRFASQVYQSGELGIRWTISGRCEAHEVELNMATASSRCRCGGKIALGSISGVARLRKGGTWRGIDKG
jgi:hypothetical protein